MVLFGTAAEASRQPIVGAHNGLQRLTQIMACHRQQHAMEVVRLLKFALSTVSVVRCSSVGFAHEAPLWISRCNPHLIQGRLESSSSAIVAKKLASEPPFKYSSMRTPSDAPSRMRDQVRIFGSGREPLPSWNPEAAGCFGEVGLVFRTKFTDASATHILLDLPRP